MPRKRATRLNQRAKPKKPDGNIGGDLDPQERREKLAVFLNDFDMEVQQRLEKIEKEKTRIQTIIEKEINVQLSYLPMEIRTMNIMDFVAAGGTVDAALTKLSGMAEDDSIMKTETMKGSVKTKKEKGVRKGKGPRDRTKMAPPSATKSTLRQRSRFQTPAMKQLPAVWDTPAVTPKFDINLPFTPGLARAPKHGERLMSLAGSPVDISATYKVNRTLKHTRIQEEEELEGAISRVAAAVPGVTKTDIHKILAEFTVSKHAN